MKPISVCIYVQNSAFTMHLRFKTIKIANVQGSFLVFTLDYKYEENMNSSHTFVYPPQQLLDEQNYPPQCKKYPHLVLISHLDPEKTSHWTHIIWFEMF